MKNRLSDADYLQILSCIEAIYRCRNLEDFPHHVLRELGKLIECNLAGYNEVNLPRNRIVVVFDRARPDIDETHLQKFGELMHEHPVIAYFDKTGDGQTLKISDFLTTREYHRRTIYRDFYREIDAEDQISFGVRVAPGFMIGIAFNRQARSFTEKDRLRLNIIRPHVIQAYLHASEAAGFHERQLDLEAVLCASGIGVISLSEKGEVLHSTPGAFDCLARYLPIPKTRTPSLPARLAKWVRETDSESGSNSFILGHDLDRLIVRHVRNEDRQLLLLSEENSQALRKRLERFDLTPREHEVLRWLAEGKANGEIATILDLTPGTVKLYVERILAKLGVENRTVAALIVHGVNS